MKISEFVDYNGILVVVTNKKRADFGQLYVGIEWFRTRSSHDFLDLATYQTYADGQAAWVQGGKRPGWPDNRVQLKICDVSTIPPCASDTVSKLVQGRMRAVDAEAIFKSGVYKDKERFKAMCPYPYKSATSPTYMVYNHPYTRHMYLNKELKNTPKVVPTPDDALAALLDGLIPHR